MEKNINGISFVVDEVGAEERDVMISAVLEVVSAKNGKNNFTKLSAQGKYLREQLDNEEILDDEAYYDIRITKSSGVSLPVDPSLNGIYIVQFIGRAWIDTRADENEEPLLESEKRQKVYLKGHDFVFKKKANLINKK